MKKQRGSTLLEVLVTTAILSASLIGLARMSNDAHKQTKNTVTAQQFKQVMDASNRYVQDNYAIIQGTATDIAPAVITTAMLKATNYLPAGFSGTNPYGQSVQVEVLQPTSGNLQAVPITTGGTAIPDVEAPSVATKIGAGGGYTPAANPTVANGPYAGWSLPLVNYTQPGAGHLVGLLYFNNGQLVTDYLRRHAVPGHPEANSMYTPLNMKALAVEGTSDALCIVGDATTYGRIAADAVGAVLSCQTGIWKKQGSSYWKDPVNTYAALPTTDQIGTVRMTTDTGRGFMWNGVTWIPLAVDQNGNLTLPGTLTAGNVQLTNVVTENTACSGTGLTARDSSGLILSCQSGVWSRQQKSVYYSDLSTLLPSYVAAGDGICTFNPAYITSHVFNATGQGVVSATGSINTSNTTVGGFVCITLDGSICGAANNAAGYVTGVMTGSCQRMVSAGVHTVQIVVTNPLQIFGMSINVVPLS